MRVRALIGRALDAGLQGILAFTLPEALWLAGHGFEDLVVAYPTAARARAARALGAGGAARERVTVMVDCAEHLDAIRAAGATAAAPVKVCLDVDAGWRPLGGRVRIGAKRSPLHTPEAAAALAREVAARPELVLDGLMSYEAHIAGVGDRPPGRLGRARRGGDLRACRRRRRASWRRAAPRSSPRCARSRRCASSTAAGPARSSAPPPSPR